MVLALFVCAALLRDDPKTFRELEIAKIRAYEGLAHYSEVFRVATGESVMTRSMLLDGEREHVTVTLPPNGEKMETMSNGVTTWGIVHPKKTWYATKSVADKRPPEDRLAKTEKESINFAMSDHAIQFTCDPQFVLQSISEVEVDGKKLRKAVSVSKVDKREATLVQWFLPDKWFLTKFDLTGHGKEGPVDMHGQLLSVDYNATVRGADFTLDPAYVAGYTMVAAPKEGG